MFIIHEIGVAEKFVGGVKAAVAKRFCFDGLQMAEHSIWTQSSYSSVLKTRNVQEHLIPAPNDDHWRHNSSPKKMFRFKLKEYFNLGELVCSP